MPFPSLHLQRLFHLLSSRRRISLDEAQEDPAILHLDDRVLHRIHKHLSLVDRVCLSLTCKRFFNLYGAIVKHEELAFPWLWNIRIPLRVVDSRRQAMLRNQLLLRLENRRWVCCWMCLKLHPRTEFPWYSHSLFRRPLDRTCTDYAGIVDLCPCISLTVRGRERLIKFLESSPKPQTQHGPFEYTFTRSGAPCLTHSCGYRYRRRRNNYNMRVWVTLTINAGRLKAATRYTVQFPSPRAYIKAEPIFVCPHQDLLSPENWDGDDVKIDRTCVHCRTTYSTLSKGRSSPVLQVVRDLGSCKWPGDITWYDQCRLPGTSMTLKSIYQLRGRDVQREWDVFTAAEQAKRGCSSQMTSP